MTPLFLLNRRTKHTHRSITLPPGRRTPRHLVKRVPFPTTDRCGGRNNHLKPFSCRGIPLVEAELCGVTNGMFPRGSPKNKGVALPIPLFVFSFLLLFHLRNKGCWRGSPNKIEPLSLETGNPKAPRVPSYSAGTGVSNGKLPNVRGKDFPKRPISRPARPRTFPFRPPCLPKSLVVFFVVGLSLVPHPQDKEVFDPGLFGFEHLIFDKCGSTLYFVYKVHLRGLPLVESPSNHIQSPNVSITGYFPATSTLLPPKRLRLSPEWAHQ